MLRQKSFSLVRKKNETATVNGQNCRNFRAKCITWREVYHTRIQLLAQYNKDSSKAGKDEIAIELVNKRTDAEEKKGAVKAFSTVKISLNGNFSIPKRRMKGN